MAKTSRPKLEEFTDSQVQLEELRSANLRLQRQLAAAKERVEDLVAATLQGAHDGYLVVPRSEIPKPPRSASKGKAEVALWHLTDWQGGKRTTSYNSEVMRRRVRLFWEKARQITEIQRGHHPVDEAVLLFGGDMIEGVMIFPRQAFEIDSTLHTQWETVSQLVLETVEFALSIYSRVRVISEWGNHGRFGSKRDNVPRADNVDRMVYAHARARLRERALGDRLQWEDSAEDIQRVQIGNYRALLIHGDEVGRLGFVAAQTMIQHVNRWVAGAYPWEFRDCYVGHYHRHAEEPLASGGAIYWSGSPESDNRYAREQLAAGGEPTQRLHFIDPDKGRVSSQHKIYLS
jgi:hypothetical protein